MCRATEIPPHRRNAPSLNANYFREVAHERLMNGWGRGYG